MSCHRVRHRRHHNTRRRKIATDIAKGVLERRLHAGHPFPFRSDICYPELG